MKKIFLFFTLILIADSLHSQVNNLIGNWVLVEHTQYDSTVEKYVNVYSGQIYRSFQFNSDGTLKVWYNNKEYNGSWSYKKKGSGYEWSFSYNTDLSQQGYRRRMSGGDLNSDLRTGKLNISERLPKLYGEPESENPNIQYGDNLDSLMDMEYKSGTSYYIKDIDVIHDKIDMQEAGLCFSKGMNLINEDPNDVNAISLLKRCVQLRPTYYVLAYYHIARLTPIEDSSAFKYLNFAIQLMPGNKEFYLEKGKRSLHFGKTEEALNALNWYLLIEPKNDSILKLRNELWNTVETGYKKDYGITYKNPEDTLKAAEYFQMAIQLKNKNPDYFSSKIWTYLEKANKLWPYHYWQAYAWTRKVDLRDENIKIAITLKPDLSSLYGQRAGTKVYVGDYVGYVNDLNIEINLDTANWYNYRSRGFALAEELNLPGLAIKDFTKIIEMDSLNSEAYYHRGTYYFEMGEIEKGCNDLKRAKELGYWTNSYIFEKCGIPIE